MNIDFNEITSLKLEINVYTIMDSILFSKLKVKGQQISCISDKYIKINPTTKGSLHDSMLKLKNDLSNVVVKV